MIRVIDAFKDFKKSKKDGSKRLLGILIIKDRIIQVAAKIVMEPIFVPDFKEYSYGFRVKRSAHQALEVIRKDSKLNIDKVLN